MALLAAAAILLCRPTAPPEPLVFDSASNTSCPVWLDSVMIVETLLL